MDQQSCSLNLHIGYVKEWGIKEGLREIIANAYDEENVVFSYCDGFAYIANDGTLSWRHLTLGCSEKKENAIGQFGEGLKVGALTFVRDGRQIEVYSDNLSVRFSLEPWHDTQVLTATEIPNTMSPINRTTVKVQCTEEELGAARKLFIENGHQEQIMEKKLFGNVNLYIRGVFAQTLEYKGYADYNITDRSVTNRDRSILDPFKVSQAIGKMILNYGDPAVWFKRFVSIEDSYETTMISYYEWYSLKPTIREKWTSYVNSIVNDRTCFSIENVDPEQAMLLKDSDWILLNISSGLSPLFDNLAIFSINSAIEAIGEERRTARLDVLERSSLTKNQLQRLEAVEYVAREYYGYNGPDIEIVKANAVFLGSSNYSKGISLSEEVLDYEDLKEILEIAVEEVIHYVDNADDLSRRFQSASCKLIATLTTQFFGVGNENTSKA
jgi:hypothetical protein